MNKLLFTLLCLFGFYGITNGQSDLIEISNEIHYLVDIEYGAKDNRPNLSERDRELLLQTLRDGVENGTLVATRLHPETFTVCRKCVLTFEEFESEMTIVEEYLVEDPLTGDFSPVATATAYSIADFINVQFIEEWDISPEGEFIKSVKAIGLNKAIYNDDGVFMGYQTLCHVWFK